MKEFAQVYTISKWQSRDLNSCFVTPKAMLAQKAKSQSLEKLFLVPELAFCKTPGAWG